MPENLIRKTRTHSIGYTDGVLSKHVTPSSTTISQYGQNIGEKAVYLLIAKIEKDSEEDTCQIVIIETELIEGESTK